MKGAVIYARYSCEKQNDQSIESQLRVCRDFAEKNGLTIIDTYADRATTGTNDNRAEFQRMLADAEMLCTPKVGQTFGGAYFYGKKRKQAEKV